MQVTMREYALRAGKVALAAVLAAGLATAVAAEDTEPAVTLPPVSAPAVQPAASPAPAAESPAPAPAPAQPVYTGPRLGLLIMPFDSQVEQNANTLGPKVARAMKDASMLSRRYNGVLYNPRHPVIRRAQEENVLRESDVRGPFGIEDDQIERALRIAQVMEFPRVMVGAITDFEFNSEKREGQITITAEILNAETGRVEGQTLVATGRSPANMVAGLPEQFALAATEDAVQQIVARFPGIAQPTVAQNGSEGQAPPEEAAAGPKKKKNNTGILAALAILAGILIAGGGGGGGGGTGIDGPPPPPF
jgi:hypothetical protein